MLTSVLLILIRSAEKNDPSIINQILTLASQFCEQIPMKHLSSPVLSPTTHHFLWKPLQPLTNYINELYLSEDQRISNQCVKILLSISIVKGSLKDILSVLRKLIFNKDDVYNVRGLLLQMNDCVLGTISRREEMMHKTLIKKASVSTSHSDSNEDANENEDASENEHASENEDANENEDASENEHASENEDANENEDETEGDNVNSYVRQDYDNDTALSEAAGQNIVR
ncbi:unnamed protein product [Rotaria sordida]|uniref:Uncharacterized protein n=1 Tax=Rotaria sordida TaxID=392033 RepID=A0A815KR89_9BILA|nr:unnamed protein product [Rotaria sordida]CAF1623736.1 unnamed protein product [Rotaria sordida]